MNKTSSEEEEFVNFGRLYNHCRVCQTNLLGFLICVSLVSSKPICTRIMVSSGHDHFGIFLQPKRRAPSHPGLDLGHDHWILHFLGTVCFRE